MAETGYSVEQKGKSWKEKANFALADFCSQKFPHHSKQKPDPVRVGKGRVSATAFS
jgi:hypothetical protein